eukprot:COSAG01_NODE_21221_length_912_cov_1.392374_1_plen_64_part_00
MSRLFLSRDIEGGNGASGLIKGQLPAALAVGYAATAIGGVYFCIFAFLQCQQQRRGATAHSLY